MSYFRLSMMLSFTALIGAGIGWGFNEADIFDEIRDKDPSIAERLDDLRQQRYDADLDLFWAVWEELDEKHVDAGSANSEERIFGAIKGMVGSLEDPYTVFMTPDESEEFSASLEGTLEGIGAELTMEEEAIVVVSPLKESPAERAGLLPGDVIFAVDGERIDNQGLFEVIAKIRGEKGTTVTLTILREGARAPFEISIVRDSINIESVTIEELEGNITYISVNQFNEKTNQAFGQAISEMILDKPDGLIIDLRFNGGGFLEIATELLSYLLPEGTEAVEIKYSDGKSEVARTNGNAKLLDVPVVVLVNGGSASASEIVAGAIQDLERGIIMGTQTFGKGSVQEVDMFANGASLRITIAKWFTPDGRSIDEVGITPDIIVEIEEADVDAEFDRQKEEAAQYLREL